MATEQQERPAVPAPYSARVGYSVAMSADLIGAVRAVLFAAGSPAAWEAFDQQVRLAGYKPQLGLIVPRRRLPDPANDPLVDPIGGTPVVTL